MPACKIFFVVVLLQWGMELLSALLLGTHWVAKAPDHILTKRRVAGVVFLPHNVLLSTATC